MNDSQASCGFASDVVDVRSKQAFSRIGTEQVSGTLSVIKADARVGIASGT
ncbi:hypothetical protein ACMFWY_00115 [Roseiconus sp. JC912]|uniref:hypothetical protein n=1 Tax=Roseiconus sp. JC912 TaxID=3396307 RepID=UPI003A4C7CDB